MSDTLELPNQELLSLVGSPKAPMIVDICTDEDFAADPYLIPGAFRHAHQQIPALITRLAGQEAVIVCQKGLKLSHGVAAWLRAEGLSARALQGGMYGWRDLAGAPRLPFAALPAPRGGATLWAAPASCALPTLFSCWFLRRFVDRAARILFVPTAQLEGVCARFDVEPLGDLANHGQPGPASLPQRFELSLPGLDALVHMIDAEITPAWEAGTLSRLIDGLALLHPEPAQRLDASLALFDALYAAMRNRAGAAQ